MTTNDKTPPAKCYCESYRRTIEIQREHIELLQRRNYALKQDVAILVIIPVALFLILSFTALFQIRAYV